VMFLFLMNFLVVGYVSGIAQLGAPRVSGRAAPHAPVEQSWALAAWRGFVIPPHPSPLTPTLSPIRGEGDIYR
jgi:hypothetical protein